jgi:hypothetical protein
MVCRITDDIINALQHCRLKAYFQLHGEAGAPCGYEKLLIEQRANVRRKAIEKIRREHSETEMATDLNLSVANLRKGAPFILGARLDDDRHAVLFDGLRKTDGPSMLGDFRYEPVIFCAARRVRASDRQELAAHAIPSGAGSGGASRRRSRLSWARQREDGHSFRADPNGCGKSPPRRRALATRRGPAEAAVE